MKEIRHLTVTYHDRPVGVLAEAKGGKVAFQYDKAWLNEGFSINPLSLPMTDKVYLPKSDVFEGLFGVFADSLPDGWGRLLVDRMLLSKKMTPASVSAVQRLGIVGRTGMGALEYAPEWLQLSVEDRLDFDQLSQECEKILKEENSENLDTLFRLGGSSGGARPKVLVVLEGQPWIVKFPSSYDRKTIGEEEFYYMSCAEKCGIQVPNVKLFPSAFCKGYFGAERFDRIGNKKVHMVTVSGLLETSHRIPNLDYHHLMKLTYLLTKDGTQIEEMFRRMCFNVFAHNRDDHSKNFSYLYDEAEEQWRLTPAYDLTYSNSIGGEHATCVNGNGKNPSKEDLIEVGKAAGLTMTKMKKIIVEIEEIVKEDLRPILKRY